jgi:ferredoxin-NADP reductase/Na+-translocating ferredoxin:NAD+ oxidoreductase RnfD subunit
MSAVDSFLNRITMYRLVLYGLWVLAGVATVEAFLGWLSFTPIDLIVSLLLLLLSTRAVNAACALFTKATPTPESAYVTALILFFILSPIQSSTDALFFLLAGAIAMLSKYLLVFGKKHIFNPAALAALVLSVAGTGLVVWWIATPVLLPFVLIIGFLVIRKVRRFELFWYFALTALAVCLARAALLGSSFSLVASASEFLTSFPLFYFGAFMLTEPQTMPANEGHRRIFAVLVGFLFSVSFAFGPLTASPELTLLLGNLYAFAVNMRKRVTLSLHSVTKLSRDAYEYAFVASVPSTSYNAQAILNDANASFRFQPGQYLEWTLGHKSPDKRGIRRYFTIASAPSDPYVRLAVKMPVESSTFKAALRGFKKGNEITAAGVYGSFLLPKNPDTGILAIAGEIGIAPFISMFRELAALHERRDVVLIYAATTPLDFAYEQELEEFQDSIGLKVIYLPTDFSELAGWNGPSGYITDELIHKEVPDYKDRTWYLSGPNAMVESYRMFARQLGIARRAIKTHHFPGF